MKELAPEIAIAIHRDVVHSIESLNTCLANAKNHQEVMPIPHWFPIIDTLEQLKKLYAASYAYIDEVVADLQKPKEEDYEEVIREITDVVKAQLKEADRTNRTGAITFQIFVAPKSTTESIH